MFDSSNGPRASAPEDAASGFETGQRRGERMLRHWRRALVPLSWMLLVLAVVAGGTWYVLGALQRYPPVPEDAETVVVLHGLGRTPASMAVLGQRLGAAGYRVVSVGYSSRQDTMVEIVSALRSALSACCADPDRVHFVTHSLGGIVVRTYLADRPAYRGRVVMLAPPSGGSEVVDALGERVGFEAVFGPVGSELGTGATSIPNQLPGVHYAVGVITGDRSFNPVTSWLIPGPDDGKVGVERARVKGSPHLLVVPFTHTFIMNHRAVAEQTVHFLRTGRFEGEA